MLLSICIPTYNRREKVLKTLEFLCEELKNVPQSQVELIIGDNCSTDGTYDAVLSFITHYSYIRINKNTENLGLVGNVVKLSSIAKGKYIWYVGDDDIYYDGIVIEVINKLMKDNPSLLFINHMAYIEGEKGTSGFSSAVDITKSDRYDDGRNGILDIWNQSETSLMFISSVVYNHNILLSAIEREQKCNLASPLYYSFYVGSKGCVSIIKKIFIENVWGNTSWTYAKRQVFYLQVPKILLSLHKWNYNFKDQIIVVVKYFRKHKRAVIECLLH